MQSSSQTQNVERSSAITGKVSFLSKKYSQSICSSKFFVDFSPTLSMYRTSGRILEFCGMVQSSLTIFFVLFSDFQLVLQLFSFLLSFFILLLFAADRKLMSFTVTAFECKLDVFRRLRVLAMALGNDIDRHLFEAY